VVFVRVGTNKVVDFIYPGFLKVTNDRVGTVIFPGIYQHVLAARELDKDTITLADVQEMNL